MPPAWSLDPSLGLKVVPKNIFATGSPSFETKLTGNSSLRPNRERKGERQTEKEREREKEKERIRNPRAKKESLHCTSKRLKLVFPLSLWHYFRCLFCLLQII